jgi:hypothetical protein
VIIIADAGHDRTDPAARPRQGPAGANKTVRHSRTYYDEAGRRRTAQTEVPIDRFGHICGVQYRCPKCKTTQWVDLAVASKGVPVCENDGQRMVEVPVRPVSLLPWTSIGRTVAPQLRAVWVLLGAAGAGAAVYEGHVPPVVVAAAALPAAAAAGWVARTKLLGRAQARGHLADPDSGKRRRNTIDSRARMVGYCTAAGFLWLTVAAGAGVDPHTVGGRIALTLLVVVWTLPAATWWRWLRGLRTYRADRIPSSAIDEPAGEIPMDPDEAQTRRVWRSIVAARKDDVIETRADGTTVKAARGGKLVDTWLEDWHPVEGGWGATIVGPDGMYTGDAYVAAQGAVASAFRMKTSMVTVIPDGDDENRALVLAQRTSPIRDVIRWSGPDSIDAANGTAPVAVYADGDTAVYEVYRRDWGSPHVAVFGSTGTGKSELLNLIFGIDRWASYLDGDGNRRGMVASFLIDPQQGQSFAPFVGDLAGPVATTLDEAKVLVQALTNEMLRRNRYLTRDAKTWDPRRGKWRKGRKWWDPLIDGPILTLTIDEAHAFLVDREFCAMLTAGSRMWRKCGGQIRLSTHTPLLADLGGSTALRDMLTGCFVAVFRTANSLSGPVAFNGRLTVDPRTIPAEPGSCCILSGLQPKAMLARAMWEPDWYEWIYDGDDKPIGYPAPLPPETLAAFGPDYAAWVRHAANPDAGVFVPPTTKPAAVEAPTVCVEAVRLVLGQGAPMDMDAIDAKLRERGLTYSTRTVRDALAKLRKTGEVHSADGRHQLTDSAIEGLAVAADGVGDVA